MTQTLEELRAKSLEICEDLERLGAIAHPTAGDLERMTRQMVAAERVMAQILDLEEREGTVADRDSQVADLRKYHNAGYVGGGSDEGPQHLRRGEVYDPPITRQTTKNELTNRALRALDGADYADRDRIEKLVRREDGRADSEYVIVSSDPAYRSAFRKMLRDPQYGHLSLEPEEQRAFAMAHNSEVGTAMSTSGSAAGSSSRLRSTRRSC